MPHKPCRSCARVRAASQAAWPGGHPRRHTPSLHPSPRMKVRINMLCNLWGSLNCVVACSWRHAPQAVQILCVRAAASQAAWPEGHPRSHTPLLHPSPRVKVGINMPVNLWGSLNSVVACSWRHASRAVHARSPVRTAAKLHGQEAIAGATRLVSPHRRSR